MCAQPLGNLNVNGVNMLLDLIEYEKNNNKTPWMLAVGQHILLVPSIAATNKTSTKCTVHIAQNLIQKKER